VTFIVDRLVRAGLVERYESEADRRVKRVRLTLHGANVRQELLDEYHAPPESFAVLSVDDLRTLVVILGKLSTGGNVANGEPDRGASDDRSGQ
jgi:DNA-binding MarR family transcriptional regulator